ncbi:uncharacterized protein LOC116182999 [Photinus pyralis]|nr:uncharacterized protein LOC116158980 [Photinus pyralis]XP_031357868.1 uncharacterized protein LOC116181625 [Photinus pyralis]XP_031359450.1 uncharacterized protein LOC116182999 [Photinus pyralis]
MLQFLNECDPVRESQSNIEPSETQIFTPNGTTVTYDEDIVFEGTLEDLDEYEVDAFNNSPCTSQTSTSRATTPTVSKSKRKMQNSVADLIQTAVQSLESCKKRPHIEDEFDIFAKTIATELRKVEDPYKIRMLKKEIFTKVVDAQYD